MKLTSAPMVSPSAGLKSAAKAIIFCAAYAIIWVILWELSRAFWYLPAGLRFATLFYTKPSTWPIWIVGEWLGILYLNDAYTNYSTILDHGLGNFAPSVVYLAALAIYSRNRDWASQPVKTQSEVVAISSCMAFAAVGASVFLYLLMPNESPFLVFERFSVLGIATYALGDLAGIVFIWSAFESLRIAKSQSMPERNLLLRNTLLVAIPILCLALLLTKMAPSFGWAVLVVTLVPIVYLSSSHGWVGATLSVVILNVIAGCQYALSGDDQAFFVSQVFLVSVGVTGLFLGAAISQQIALVTSIREISQRVIDTQEMERGRISKDLHDHVGQVLTALRSKIEILRQKANSNVSQDLDGLDKLAADAFKDVHDIVGELSPNELTQFGLKVALENPLFQQMLAAANIEFRRTIDSDLSTVPLPVQIATYRIAQEALANVARHSQATKCNLSVHINSTTQKKVLHVVIDDNGKGFDTSNTVKGHGLQNIEDRVQALSGEFRIHGTAFGTTLQAEIPF